MDMERITYNNNGLILLRQGKIPNVYIISEKTIQKYFGAIRKSK